LFEYCDLFQARQAPAAVEACGQEGSDDLINGFIRTFFITATLPSRLLQRGG
jgi:hypothetical protein